jgi:hypothetical protein
MNLGSRPFCVINMDGSWPEMVAGCDIQAYQDCLLQFRDAWKTVHDQGKGKVGAHKRKQVVGASALYKASNPLA